jgi:hypothetical protein
MRFLIAFICLPVSLLAQQPAKPVILPASQKVVVTQQDVDALVSRIQTLTEEMKGTQSTMSALQKQLEQWTAARKKAELEKNATPKDDRVKLDKLGKQIDNHNQQIENANKKMEAMASELTKMEADLKKLNMELEQKRTQMEREKASKNKAEAAGVFSQVQLIIDSLPPSERSALTEAELKTIKAYKEFAIKDQEFRELVKAWQEDARLQTIVDVRALDNKSQQSSKAVIEKIRQHLKTLTALQQKIIY